MMTSGAGRLPPFIASYSARVDRCLDMAIGRLTAPELLVNAMRYSLFNGGKRVRPALVYSTATALRGDLATADSAACGVELIHAYSLIHDDLPSMDDDALRRGKPTTHIAFGEATAILAGDAMQALAFELISAPNPDRADRALEMVNVLARACGAEGMVAGQTIDIQATGSEIQVELLEQMHMQKTAALIAASVRLGALCCGEGDDRQEALQRYGDCLGLAFQVQDDILDIEGTEEETGKRTGADLLLEKSTYVSIHGMAAAKSALRDLAESAHEAILPLGDPAEELHLLVDFVVNRSF